MAVKEKVWCSRIWAMRSALLVSVLAIGILVFGLSRSQEHSLPNGGLIVRERFLELGEVWQHPQFVLTLPIENPTPKDVDVVGLDRSCACLAAEPASFRVPAGATQDVKMTLDLRYGGKEGELKRDFVVFVYPRIAGSTLRQSGWRIAGCVRVPFTLDPPEVRYEIGTVVRGEAVGPKAVRVLSHAGEMDTVIVQCKPPLGMATVSKAGAQGFRIDVVPSPDLPLGPFAFDVVLEGRTCSPQMPLVGSLPVRGIVVDDVEAVGAPVMLGLRNEGEVVSATVLLRSRSGRSFDVVKVAVATDDISIEKVPGGSDIQQNYRLTWRIIREGPESSKVVFHIGGANGEPTREIEVPVFCHAVIAGSGLKSQANSKAK